MSQVSVLASTFGGFSFLLAAQKGVLARSQEGARMSHFFVLASRWAVLVDCLEVFRSSWAGLKNGLCHLFCKPSAQKSEIFRLEGPPP